MQKLLEIFRQRAYELGIPLWVLFAVVALPLGLLLGDPSTRVDPTVFFGVVVPGTFVCVFGQLVAEVGAWIRSHVVALKLVVRSIVARLRDPMGAIWLSDRAYQQAARQPQRPPIPRLPDINLTPRLLPVPVIAAR